MMAAGRREGGKAGSGGTVPPSRRSALPPVGRLLGVDWGERRIGLAISDAGQRLAQPLATLTRRTGRRFPLARLRPLLEQHAPVGIVVGLPLDAEGAEGPSTDAARALGALLTEKTGLPVSYVDERMSTARVLKAVREMGGTTRYRRGEVDRLSATVFLQAFLDGRAG